MFIGNSVRSQRGTIEVSVLVDGVEQPLYRRPWDGKIFVAGMLGQVYTLRVKNLTSGRIEVINTVDGRHTLDDEPGDSQRNRGLVFSSHSTGAFTGWRISDQRTREFIFGSPERSIAAQATGSTENVGVIGFAVYREKFSGYGFGDEVYRGGGLESFSATRGATKGGPATFGGESYATRGGSLGTSMGASQDDRVGRTTFTRDGVDPDVLVIGYETEQVLREQGVIAPAEANPFPGAQTGYAKYQTGV
jgi:hypothetical protein